MVFLVFDYGEKRIGYSKGNLSLKIAFASGCILNDKEIKGKVVALFKEIVPEVCYIGFPLNLKGEVTLSTEKALKFANKVFEWTGFSTYLLDERFTTVMAYEKLKFLGISQKDARKNIDSVSAQIMAQTIIDSAPPVYLFNKKPVLKRKIIENLAEYSFSECESSNILYIDGGEKIFEVIEKEDGSWEIFEKNPWFFVQNMKKRIPGNVKKYSLFFGETKKRILCP